MELEFGLVRKTKVAFDDTGVIVRKGKGEPIQVPWCDVTSITFFRLMAFERLWVALFQTREAVNTENLFTGCVLELKFGGQDLSYRFSAIDMYNKTPSEESPGPPFLNDYFFISALHEFCRAHLAGDRIRCRSGIWYNL